MLLNCDASIGLAKRLKFAGESGRFLGQSGIFLRPTSLDTLIQLEDVAIELSDEGGGDARQPPLARLRSGRRRRVGRHYVHVVGASSAPPRAERRRSAIGRPKAARSRIKTQRLVRRRPLQRKSGNARENDSRRPISMFAAGFFYDVKEVLPIDHHSMPTDDHRTPGRLHLGRPISRPEELPAVSIRRLGKSGTIGNACLCASR
jgi:hypothetical protein